MADYGPTFKPSRKPQVRIKPAGWTAIAIALTALVGGAALGLNAISGRGRIEPLAPADLATRHEAAYPHSVWWQVQLGTVADPLTGREYLVAPPQVLQEVIAQAKTSPSTGGAEGYEVKDFSEDGLECTLGVLEASGRLLLYRMRYDPQDRQWKTSSLLYTVEREGNP